MLLNFVLTLITLVLPPPGSVYQKKINIPIIGSQVIETKVITNNFAYITLSGLINEKGTAKYINSRNKHYIRFSYNLRKIIKKYNTEFTFPYYDDELDEIFFNLNVKLINFNTKIKMKRIN